MEESIKILEEIIESTEKSINRLEDNDLSGTMRGVLELRKRQTQSLLNLINKYKELEADLYASNSIINEYIENNKEQEKMIELMAEAFKQDDIRSKEEIIEHFKKKAKGE